MDSFKDASPPVPTFENTLRYALAKELGPISFQYQDLPEHLRQACFSLEYGTGLPPMYPMRAAQSQTSWTLRWRGRQVMYVKSDVVAIGEV
jgi:hypothetical protein